jgi:hypothetical protein
MRPGLLIIAALGLAACSSDTAAPTASSTAIVELPDPTSSASAAQVSSSLQTPTSTPPATSPPAATTQLESTTSTTTTIPPPSSTIVPTTVAATSADAATLAAELSAIEARIRAPGVSATELTELGLRQQLAYRAVSAHPEWHADLVALVDPVAAVPLTFHLAARQALVDHAASRPPRDPAAELPAWTIAEPLPIDELRGYYAEAEAATGVPWQYIAAIHFQETRMGRIVGVSPDGAVGPMQFLPSTWEQCCDGDPTVARDAIIGAAQYLVIRGAPGDMQRALNGYNPNSGYVGAVTAYAENMIADERAYLGYHGWDVFFTSSAGTVRLPVGYSAATPVDVVAYLGEFPGQLVP